MSDFDTVLERLVTDPAFASALAADRGSALAGYRLADDEVTLLCGQVSCGDTGGGASAVESRTTKSSTFGLFSSVGSVLAEALGDWGAVGSAAGGAAGRTAEAVGSATGAGGGQSAPREAFGDAPRARLGDVVRTVHVEEQHVKGVGDYHNRVDADGDGDWDKATYAARADGGVDIMVDLDHDGRADFVGRDLDRDWKVDQAVIDRDRDGVFEKTMYDDNNDGILDRTVWHKD